MVKQNVPQLRFRGYNYPWEKFSMDSIATKITDGTHDTPLKLESGIPFLTAIHVKDGRIDIGNCYYVSEKDHKIIYKRCNPEFGDLLMVNIGAGTATSAMIDVDYEFSLKNVALIKPDRNKVNPFLLCQIQRKNSSRLQHQLSSGGAQPFLSLKQIKKLDLLLPNELEEQQKIASFLSAVDTKIEQLTQKKELLEQYKKGVMQKLFPKHGAQNPELRFKDENGNDFPDWEVKRLGDVLELKYGKDYKHLNNGTIPLLGTGGVMQYVDDYLYDKPSVLIGRKGSIQNPQFIEEPFWTVDTLFYTKVAKRIDPYFSYLIVKTINLLKYNEASGVPSLSATTLSSIKISIPESISEQKKIAKFVRSIDRRTNKIGDKILKAQTFKKGLLQQMFV